MSRRLLIYYKSPAPYEALSIERLKADVPLSPIAQEIFDHALRYGILMERGANFSRTHHGLTARVDLNKMFTPAFRTTYRVRNHIYLSAQEFEMLMVAPGSLAQRRNVSPSPRSSQGELPL